MSFEDILNRWEEQRRRSPVQEKKRKGPKKASRKEAAAMDSWLEMYPPGRELAGEKERPDRIIIHTEKKRLNRMEPQDCLDLHGWKGAEALQELDRFLKKCKRRGLKKVLIVHGKGIHSPGGESVLRPLVKGYLEKSALVKDFGRAPGRSGGSGATWILLR